VSGPTASIGMAPVTLLLPQKSTPFCKDKISAKSLVLATSLWIQKFESFRSGLAVKPCGAGISPHQPGGRKSRLAFRQDGDWLIFLLEADIQCRQDTGRLRNPINVRAGLDSPRVFATVIVMEFGAVHLPLWLERRRGEVRLSFMGEDVEQRAAIDRLFQSPPLRRGVGTAPRAFIQSDFGRRTRRFGSSGQRKRIPENLSPSCS
jgi:hypothetical protein